MLPINSVPQLNYFHFCPSSNPYTFMFWKLKEPPWKSELIAGT